jgi:hypothetical protein
VGRRTGASRSELLQAVDAGFTSLGEDRQQQQQDDEEEDEEEEHRRQAGGEEYGAEGLEEGPAAASRGRLRSAPRHDAGHGAQPARRKAHTVEPGDRGGGAVASSTRGAADMMPVVFDCGACGKEEEWEEQLAKLKHYKEGHGDCNVPKQWAADAQLGRWVNNQRGHKKKLDRGEPSGGMTAARAAKLDLLGFAWELSAAALSRQRSRGQRNDAGWEGWLAKLEVYNVQHGDCNVPNDWVENPKMANWVSRQR